MSEDAISYRIIGAAIEVYKALGPGLFESVYEEALAYDLNEMNLKIKRQHGIPMNYKNMRFEKGFRLDLLVENKVIIEVKSVEVLAPVHFSQVLTYLKLSDRKLGLLINFNSNVLKGHIHRIVNGLDKH